RRYRRDCIVPRQPRQTRIIWGVGNGEQAVGVRFAAPGGWLSNHFRALLPESKHGRSKHERTRMIVREPLVQATYYYLYEAPGDTSDRREDRYRQFVEDTQRMLASVAGWLAMPAPEMPRLAAVNSPPRTLRPLMELAELRGHTNAAAWLQAYALRNMLLLRVVLARPGDHEHTIWRTLDESLGHEPTTPNWLATARYWCGMAPRLPEDLDAQFPQTMRLEFGLFSPGEADAHLLLYPDARSETRARPFLSVNVPRLDWYPVEARHTLVRYHDHGARAGRAPPAPHHRAAPACQGR